FWDPRGHEKTFGDSFRRSGPVSDTHTPAPLRTPEDTTGQRYIPYSSLQIPRPNTHKTTQKGAGEAPPSPAPAAALTQRAPKHPPGHPRRCQSRSQATDRPDATGAPHQTPPADAPCHRRSARTARSDPTSSAPAGVAARTDHPS